MYAGEANLTSFLFMNVYACTFILFIYLRPFVDELIKKGEKNLESLYIHALIFIVYAYMFVLFMRFIEYHLFISMHELRGASTRFIFNSCIYNSMSFFIIKKGGLLA